MEYPAPPCLHARGFLFVARHGQGLHAIPDSAESARVSVAMLDFNKQVNAMVVAPGFIVRVRKKLSLDQTEASEIFGGGVNAFSR